MSKEQADKLKLNLPELAEPGEEEVTELESEAPAPESEAHEAPETETESEVVVSIGEPAAEEEPVQAAPTWVRELRKSKKEADRRIRELEQQLASKAPEKQAVTLGEEPTLEGCDFDADKFKADLIAYHERKRSIEAEKAKQAAEIKAQQDAWNARLEAHKKLSAELKVADFDDAQEVATANLSELQQAIVVNGSDNSALLIYALGKNEAKVKELAAITDPVKFAFAVAKLETQLKVTPRKVAPAPESKVVASGRTVGSVDKTLERLREKADRTGDRTEVANYMRKQKLAQSARR